jgi:hypothetical protein
MGDSLASTRFDGRLRYLLDWYRAVSIHYNPWSKVFGHVPFSADVNVLVAADPLDGIF